MQMRPIRREEIGAQELSRMGKTAVREVRTAVLAENGIAVGAYLKDRLYGILCASVERSLHISYLYAISEKKEDVLRALLYYAQEIAESYGVKRIKLSAEKTRILDLDQSILIQMGFVKVGEAVNVFCRLDKRGQNLLADWLLRSINKQKILRKKGIRDDAFSAVSSELMQNNVRVFSAEYPFLRNIVGNSKIDLRCSRWVSRAGEPAAFCVLSPFLENRNVGILEYLGCLSKEKGTGSAYFALVSTLRAVLETGRYHAIIFSFRADNPEINSILRISIIRKTIKCVRRTSFFVKHL